MTTNVGYIQIHLTTSDLVVIMIIMITNKGHVTPDASAVKHHSITDAFAHLAGNRLDGLLV